jgi:cold shock CspA family protein
LHIEAITNAGFTDPIEGRLLSILLEHEKELQRLRMR